MRAYTADTITKQNVSFTGVGSISGHNYVGGIAGSLGTASVAGLLNTTLGVASYLAFTVDSVTLNGAADAFAVSGTERVGGGFGEAIGGSVTNVSVNNLASVTGENLVGGFIGLSGPGELVGSDGGLTVNLLGLNYLLKLNNLLSLGQAVEVTITNANVNGIKSGFTVEATGAREENSVRDYTASGFMARSNSTKAEDAHVTNLKSVTAANDGGYAAGFVAISKTGGLAEVGDDNSVKSLLEANELVNAIGYLIPSYTKLRPAVGRNIRINPAHLCQNVLLFIVALHGIVDVGDTPHLAVHLAGAPSAVRIDFINRDGLLHRSRDFVAASRSACGGIFI